MKASPPVPVIFWHSDPVLPGETLVVIGEDFANDAVLELARAGPVTKPLFEEQLVPVRRDSRRIEAVVPASWLPGVYFCRVRQAGEVSSVATVNGSHAWWIQGERGNQASHPNGWFRVFGKNLDHGGRVRVALRAASMIWLDGARGVLIEGNTFEGNQLATGKSFPVLDLGRASCENLCFAENCAVFIFCRRDENPPPAACESLRAGGILRSEGTKLTLREPPGDDGEFSGAWGERALYIVAGRGTGQYRKITSGVGADLTLDRAWNVEPDGTSVVRFAPFRRRHLFLGNAVMDFCGASWFGISGCEGIWVENRVVCAEQNAGPRSDGTGSPQWGNLFLDTTDDAEVARGDARQKGCVG